MQPVRSSWDESWMFMFSNEPILAHSINRDERFLSQAIIGLSVAVAVA